MEDIDTRIPSPELKERLDSVRMLQGMTDAVLLNAGWRAEQITTIPVVTFTVEHPERDYDLRIYSIADGVGGFNASQARKPDKDSSRRWAIYINRGTIFGAAYDNKGTVYQQFGKFEPSPYSRQNIETGSISELLTAFYEDHVADIEYIIPKGSLGSNQMTDLTGSAPSDRRAAELTAR